MFKQRNTKEMKHSVGKRSKSAYSGKLTERAVGVQLCSEHSWWLPVFGESLRIPVGTQLNYNTLLVLIFDEDGVA
jgi:hypothetical protein